MKASLRHSIVYFLVYKMACYFIFRSVGPLVVLMTLNAKLMRALRDMRRRHRYMTRSHRQRENVTLTLVVVISVFIVCELPDACLRMAVTFIELSPPSRDPNHDVIQIVNPITNALLAFNSSVNFLIYCLIGKKFRRILARMCLRGCQGGGGGGAAGGRDARADALTYNATASQSQTATANSYALTNLQANGTVQQQQHKTDAVYCQKVYDGGITL